MALTADRIPKEITFADSPQFVTVDSDGATGTPNVWELRLWVWHGLKASPPVTPTRVLTSGAGLSARFEIAQFIKPELSIDEYPTTYNETSACWYYFQITSDTDLNTYTSTTNLATMGVGEYREGVNPGTTVAAQNNKVFKEYSTQSSWGNGMDLTVPIFIGQASLNTNIITGQGALVVANIDLAVDEGLVLNSTDSAKQWAYVNVGGTLSCGINYHFQVNAGDQLKYNFYTEPNTRPKKLRYLSRAGSVIDLPINGGDILTENAIGTTYENQFPLYEIDEHQTKTYQINAESLIDVNSGWVDEAAQQQFSELLTSKRVWFIESVTVYPCQIQSNSIRFINRTYDRQVGYDMIIKLSNPVLNYAY